MSVQEEVFCDLLIQVSDTHGSFRGMSPVAAETYYIVEAQNLEGMSIARQRLLILSVEIFLSIG
jgi:hypothetical protein